MLNVPELDVEDPECRQLFVEEDPSNEKTSEDTTGVVVTVDVVDGRKDTRNRRRSDAPSFCSIPKRYIFSLMGFVACSLAVNFNSNLSIVIVSMVNRNASITSVTASNECLANQPDLENNERLIDPRYKPGDFLWSPETEGIAIGAVYYGQLLGFIPGGRMAELYGGKKTLMTSILLSSLLTMLLPIAAYTGIYAFIACRFLIGVGTAPAIPVLFHLIANWIPLTERNSHASVILAGYGVGSFSGFIAAGELCGTDFLGGWPAVFYVYGLTGCVWTLLCYFLVYETPQQHPTISLQELNYIIRHKEISQQKQIKFIPWRSMVKSLPLWSLAIGYFGQFWILGFFNTAHALYMGTILNLDIVTNGHLSSLPHLIRALFAFLCSFPMDFALKKDYVGVVVIRKGASALNTVVSCIGFVGILLVGCNPLLNTVFFTVGSLLGDFVTFGVCMACIDIAPNLSGTVSGLLSIVGVVPFFLIPALVGWVTKYERTMTQWSYIYYLTIGVAVVTTMFYLVFGTSDAQQWGVDDSEENNPTKPVVTKVNGVKSSKQNDLKY